jgi:hypothetical protein
MGRAARESVAARFSMEKMIQEHERLYADIAIPGAELVSENRFPVPVLCM